MILVKWHLSGLGPPAGWPTRQSHWRSPWGTRATPLTGSSRWSSRPTSVLCRTRKVSTRPVFCATYCAALSGAASLGKCNSGLSFLPSNAIDPRMWNHITRSDHHSGLHSGLHTEFLACYVGKKESQIEFYSLQVYKKNYFKGRNQNKTNCVFPRVESYVAVVQKISPYISNSWLLGNLEVIKTNV